MPRTLHQKNLEKFFQKENPVSLDILKQNFVETGDMNQTTLYRILDRWKNQKKIFEIQNDKKRIFLFCDCEHAHGHAGVKITFCKTCENIEESHFSLPENADSAEFFEYLKTCNHCKNYAK